jgi:hypothetical protein
MQRTLKPLPWVWLLDKHSGAIILGSHRGGFLLLTLAKDIHRFF